MQNRAYWDKLLDLGSLSQNEMDLIALVDTNVTALAGYVEKFSYDLKLYDHFIDKAEKRVQLGYLDTHLMEWLLIAGRDGALNIFHFDKVMSSTKAAIRDCRPLSAKMNTARLRQSGKLLEQEFKDRIAMRNGIAHAGEFLSNKKWIAEHQHKGSFQRHGLDIGPKGFGIGSHGGLTYAGHAGATPLGGQIIQDYFQGRFFLTTFEEKIVSYELSEHTLKSLADIMNVFISAFPGLEDAH